MNEYDRLPGINPLLLGIILLSLVAGVVLYGHLPERVPIHWNIHGEVDGYGGRFMGAFGLPLVTLGLYLLMVAVPRIDPKKKNYAKFTGAYNAFMAAFVLFMLVLHAVVLLYAFGYKVDVGLIAPLGLGLMFMVMGNYLTRVRHNYFFGIKTPWTLASERVWRKTHRVGGILFVAAGLLSVASVFVSPTIRFIIVISSAIGVSVISMVYSYLVFRKIERE